VNRIFAAWVPPRDLADDVFHACAPLRLAAPALRWVPAPRLQCTMRVFGEVSDDVAAALPTALADATRLFDPMSVTVRGLGATPTWRRAQVVWAGVVADPKFELLHHEIEQRVVALGLEVEGRIFRPHVTLARIPAGTSAAAIREAARGVRVRASGMVTAVTIMARVRVPGGHRHEVVATAHLGRG
jgi:RNA 2',3'-cyclic 3'-phosphodiesterase